MIGRIVPSLMQVSPPRDSIAVAADVATIVIAAAVVVAAVMVGLLVLRLYRVIGDTRTHVERSLAPVSDRARAISDNVEFITQVLRADVESLNESVQALSERLTLASERMEERIEEFNALMEVVQGEAEDLFLDTASTLRGVRAGARSIASSGGAKGGDATKGDTPEPSMQAPVDSGSDDEAE